MINKETFFTMNLLHTLSIAHGSSIRSNFTITFCDVIAATVPIAPLTSPFLVSKFLCSITLAPIAIVSSASNPAVELHSLLSFFSWSEAVLVHLRVPQVSSIQ